MLVKDLIKNLKQLKPDDEIWASWVSRDDIEQEFANFEFEDSNGNLIDTDKYVTNDVITEVTSSLTDDDYLWERFSETLRETCQEVLERLINSVNEAEEDTDLWDTDETNA